MFGQQLGPGRSPALRRVAGPDAPGAEGGQLLPQNFQRKRVQREMVRREQKIVCPAMPEENRAVQRAAPRFAGAGQSWKEPSGRFGETLPQRHSRGEFLFQPEGRRRRFAGQCRGIETHPQGFVAFSQRGDAGFQPRNVRAGAQAQRQGHMEIVPVVRVPRHPERMQRRQRNGFVRIGGRRRAGRRRAGP